MCYYYYIIPLLLVLITISFYFRTPKTRKPGVWIPSNYKWPIPEPYPDWNIHKTNPIPYRAFKHKYNVTMGVQSMDPQDWIQLDNEWVKFHDLKQKRVEEKGKDLYDISPIALDGCIELLKELQIYLPNRYPSLFQATSKGLKNLFNNEEYDFKIHDPMFIIGNLLQDDIAILTEDSNGNYNFTAGSILLAGSWRFKDKFNKSISSIHSDSKVPKYHSNLQNSMNKFFYRLKPESPMVRYNYGFQMDDNLPWAYSSLGDEDSDSGWRFQTGEAKAISIDDIYYRSERQSLRRLPKSGVIVFTIRAYFLPLVEICKEPFVPQRLLNGVLNWDEESKEYKGFEKYKDIVIPYLTKQAELQKTQGFTMENEQLNYPMNSKLKNI